MSRSRRRSSVLGAAVAAAVLVACGNGRSILDAGNLPALPTTAPPTTEPGQTTVPGQTTIAPTTTASPLASLPDCPTHALDSVTSPVQITFWFGASGGTLSPTMQQLTDQYNSSQTKVRVNLIEQGSYEANIAKYLDSGQGARPDVVQLPEYMVQSIVDLKSAVPVGKCVTDSGFDTSPFIPGAIRAYSTGGVQWAMPFNVSDPVLYYNKKVFAKAGLDPDRPPQTLAELRAMSQQIVDSGAAKYGVALDTGFDSGGGWYLEQWLAQLGHFYVDNDNGRRARATKVVYDDAAGADLLRQVQELVASGLAVNVGDNASGLDDLLKLADNSEPAAMTIHTSASLGSVLETLQGGQFPNIGPDDVGIGPMPGPGGSGALVGGASLWITDSGDAKRVAAAWDYVRYLVDAQQQSTWSAATGYVAVRTDARELEPLKTKLADPRYAVAGDELLTLPDSPTSAGPVVGPLREMRLVAAQGISRIFSGAEVQATLGEMASQADRLIADYNSRNPG